MAGVPLSRLPETSTGRVKAVEDFVAHVLENLVARVVGPMKFRLVIQPLMAAVLAVRDGLKDAREKRPPYFWALFTLPEQRSEMLREGWKSVGKIFVIAIVIDLVEQLIDFRWFYPGEALLVAFILACIPYLLLRGAVNRVVRVIRPGASGDNRR
jgi:hypothetical protein